MTVTGTTESGATATGLVEPGPLPVIDLGDYRAGVPGALEAAGAELREALTTLGFLSVVNHGVSWDQVEGIYGEAARFHALPDEAKRAGTFSATKMGYSRLGGAQDPGRPPSLNAAFFMARPGSSRNQMPDEAAIPGFAGAVTAYYDRMDQLGHELLPLYAVALGMPAHWFDQWFDPALATLRMTHYPPLPAAEDQWGIDPHSDAGFMTMLPSNPVGGLMIRRPDGTWFEAAQEPRSFIVNSGDMLRRWSNDTFLSTVHRVRNSSGTDRYAIPYFFDPRVDTVIECLPSCIDPAEGAARHEAITYRDYLTAFMGRSYAGNTDIPS